jgi:hypothetical protein
MKLDLARLKQVKWREIDFKDLSQKARSGALVAELKKRMQIRSVLALSLESSHIAVTPIKMDQAGLQIGSTHEVPVTPDSIVSDPAKAGSVLAEILSGAGLREKRCVVCLPPRWAWSATLEVPEVAEADLKELLELRAEREFPMPVGELRLAHSVAVLPDGRRQATLVAVALKRIEAVMAMLATAGERAVSVSLGLDRAASLGVPSPSLQFLASNGHVDLVVAAGGGVSALRTLPGPTGEGFDSAAFWREVRITLGRLPEGVRRDIAEARFAGTESSVQTLMATPGEPLRRLGIVHVAVEQPDRESHPAREAAMRFIGLQPVLFELAPRIPPKWELYLKKLEDKRRRQILFGAIAVVLLPVLIFMIRSHIENSLNEEWNGMKSEVAELESVQLSIRQFRPWFGHEPRGLRCLEVLVSAFPESGEVWAKNAQLSDVGKVTCIGMARDRNAVQALTQRLRAHPEVKNIQIQQEKGDKPVTFTIVYQWEDHGAS